MTLLKEVKWPPTGGSSWVTAWITWYMMFNYSIYIKPLPSWQVFPEYSFTKHVPHYLAVGYEKQSHPSRTNMPGKSQVRKTSICMWSNKNKVTKWTKKGVCQVIQAVTFLSPNVGGHQQPLKGSRFHHAKKVTMNCQVCDFCWLISGPYKLWTPTKKLGKQEHDL